jgi:hypothetical protein
LAFGQRRQSVVPGEEELLSGEAWNLLGEARALAVEKLRDSFLRWALTPFIGLQLPDRRDWGWFCADDLTEEEKVATAFDPPHVPRSARGYVLVADAGQRVYIDPSLGDRATFPAVLFEVGERGAPGARLFQQRLDAGPAGQPVPAGELEPVGPWRNGFTPPYRVGQRGRMHGLPVVVTAVDANLETVTLSPIELFGRSITPKLDWWQAFLKVELDPDVPAVPAEPRHMKLVRDLCERAGQALERVAAGDPTRVHEGERILAWHFITDKGHHHMVEAGGKAIMFRGYSETDRVCEVETPEE